MLYDDYDDVTEGSINPNPNPVFVINPKPNLCLNSICLLVAYRIFIYGILLLMQDEENNVFVDMIKQLTKRFVDGGLVVVLKKYIYK